MVKGCKKGRTLLERKYNIWNLWMSLGVCGCSYMLGGGTPELQDSSGRIIVMSMFTAVAVLNHCGFAK